VGFVLHLQIQYISMIDVVLLSNLSYCRRSWAADVAATFDESGDELSATSVIEVNDPDGESSPAEACTPE
jgi:hypothetical protein